MVVEVDEEGVVAGEGLPVGEQNKCRNRPMDSQNVDSPLANGVFTNEEGDNIVQPLSDGVFTNEEVDDIVPPPEIGMNFKTWGDVETMYKRYGKQQGFGVSRWKAANDSKGVRCRMTWTCECWGTRDIKKNKERRKISKEMGIGGSSVVEKPKVRKRKSKKCDCKAYLYAGVNVVSRFWEIRNVTLEHTGHTPIPSDSRLVKEYRMHHFTSNMRRRLLNDVEVGVPINQIHDSLARERDGLENMPITEKDMRHVADKERKLKLEEGDAMALMAYLDRMRRDNKDFYYSVRVDATAVLQDVFWVDARCKAAYEEFGDVVCFDTTYMTNDYELPFANFVGVNHHGQTILFGCALISHEDIETFSWVFRQWLLCMGDKAPGAILTDQAAAMIRPIAEIMPLTTHRWCIWHIMHKVPHKLGALSKFG
ncbi:Protein FAR-RED IMPAIRED RESPONSE 1 [Bienertia sinuspersici]